MTFASEVTFQYAVLEMGELTWYRALRQESSKRIDEATEQITFASSFPGENIRSIVTKAAEGVTRYQWQVDTDRNVEWVMCDYAVHAEEHFYGFGETYGELDQRGKELRLRVENGCVRDLSYKPIPFYLSSALYGVYLEHNELIYARMATPDIGNRVQLKVNSDQLNLYRIEAAEIVGIIDRYTTVVGKPTLPPPWFFGAWKSRDWRTENQQTVMLDLQKQRELGIPCTVKLIDAAWEQELNDFRFHRDKFPDFAAVMKEAKQLEYQVVIWISPWVANWTDIYKELDAKGFFLKTPSGETYVHRLGNSPNLLGSMFDFTNPGAVQWWQEQVENLMQLGVRGIKTDFGEQVPDDAVFYDGSTGKTMHNYYPVLYNRVTHDVVNKYHGILLGRASWAGSQAFTGIWAGDQTADFAPRSGMLATIFAGQNIGLCGFPFWGSDIGGYFGTPDRECLIRWTQYAAFTPCMELHGLGERDPWDMDEQVLDIYKQYTSMHTRLLPYIYPLAIEGAGRGTPMMRAMMLHYNDDPNVHHLPCVQFQYMFGRDLLVAPIFYEGTNREIYLPAGGWVDLWSGRYVEGPWNGRVEAPIDQTPVWMRSGAIIPLLPDGVETIGRYDDPSRWLEALGTERWEFMLAPGEGDYRQGGVEIKQTAVEHGSFLLLVNCDHENGAVPEKIVLKVHIPLEDNMKFIITAASMQTDGGKADYLCEWRRSAWESGLWIELPMATANVYITLTRAVNMDGR